MLRSNVEKLEQILRRILEVDVTQQNFGKSERRQQHQNTLRGFEDSNGAKPAMVIAPLGRVSDIVGVAHLRKIKSDSKLM